MEVLIDECVFGTAGTFDYIVGGFDQVRFVKLNNTTQIGMILLKLSAED